MKDCKAMYWDKLIEEYGVSEETLQIITSINGYNEETLEDILYAVTGYRSFDQLNDENDDDDDDDEENGNEEHL